MSILYCEISQNNRKTLLISISLAPTIQFGDILNSINFDVNLPKRSILSDEHHICCILDNETLFLCVTDVPFPRRLAFQFLDEILAGIDWHGPSADKQIQSRMICYNTRNERTQYVLHDGRKRIDIQSSPYKRDWPPTPRIAQATDTNSNLEEHKAIAQNAIAELLERSDRMNDLVRDTEDTPVTASSTTENRSQIVCQRMNYTNKMVCYGIVAVGVVVSAIFVFLLIFPKL